MSAPTPRRPSPRCPPSRTRQSSPRRPSSRTARTVRCSPAASGDVSPPPTGPGDYVIGPAPGDHGSVDRREAMMYEELLRPKQKAETIARAARVLDRDDDVARQAL